jgi:hypothetical protein
MCSADVRQHRSHAALRAYRILQDHAHPGLGAALALFRTLLEGALPTGLQPNIHAASSDACPGKRMDWRLQGGVQIHTGPSTSRK